MGLFTKIKKKPPKPYESSMMKSLKQKPSEDPFDSFNYTGLHYKGLIGSCMSGKRKGKKVGIGIGFKSYFHVRAQYTYTQTKGNCTLIVAENQYPLKKVEAGANQQNYLCLAVMRGIWGKVKHKGKVSVGVGTELKKKKDKKKENQPKNLSLKERVGKIAIESAALELGVSLTAGLSKTGESMFVYDELPRWYPQDELYKRFKQTVLKFLKLGNKQDIKQQVCEYLTKKNIKTSYEKKLFGHISSAKLIQRLEELDKVTTSKTEKAKIAEYISLLKFYQEDISEFQNKSAIYTFFHIIDSNKWTTDASLTIQASIPGITGTVSSSIKTTKKSTYYRYQVEMPDGTIRTQDTVINYNTFDFSPLTASLNAPKVSISKGLKHIVPPTLNTMTYISANLFWEPQFFDKTYTRAGRIKVLPGSGVCFGQSVVFDNLYELVKIIDSVPKDGEKYISVDKEQAEYLNYAATIASNLRISLTQLMNFLMFPQTKSIIDQLYHDPSLDVGAVLIETAFSVQDKEISGRPAGEKTPVIEPPDLIEENGIIFKLGKPQRITLRYRLVDVKKDKGGFSFPLGFIPIVKPRFKLKSVQEVGSEGVIDVCTYWMDESVNNMPPADAYNRPETIPSAALFYQ